MGLDGKSLFIVLEGIDGSGKSTFTPVVSKFFADIGKNVWVTKEPTDDYLGKIARESLKWKNSDWVRALLMAADRDVHTKEIRKFLKQPNSVVICDRYKHSSLAYQTLSFPAEDINVLNKGNLDPDLVIYFDVIPEIALARIDSRGEEKDVFEKADLLRRIKKNYDEMDMGNCIKINANLDMKSVQEDLLYKLKQVFI